MNTHTTDYRELASELFDGHDGRDTELRERAIIAASEASAERTR